jgi:hypothetical protein
VNHQEEEFLKLERVNNVLMLEISADRRVSFRQEWVEQHRALPYDQFGEFIRDTVYPALSAQERKLWNGSKISNRDLQIAIWDLT